MFSRIRDMTKRLMSSHKCRSVEVINNPVRPRSNHWEVNYINNNNKKIKKDFELCDNSTMIKTNVKVRGSTNSIRNKYSINSFY